MLRTTPPPAVDATLTFTPDYAARRATIERTATSAYVCGVATAASHRNRGLAQALLQRSFQAAAATGRLQRVVLSTQRVNRSAVRAYERSGMRVTEALDDGHVALKALHATATRVRAGEVPRLRSAANGSVGMEPGDGFLSVDAPLHWG
ncbi:hypothetical protein PINS_up014392 [Pythium insidiosum]|nr:hypothetical protein PINS_up014392 [Pythium insidiosum]